MALRPPLFVVNGAVATPAERLQVVQRVVPQLWRGCGAVPIFMMDVKVARCAAAKALNLAVSSHHVNSQQSTLHPSVEVI